MEKIYNKLVRDKIPDIIMKDNEIPVTRILSDSEYRLELNKKLCEECQEVVSSKEGEEVIEELADVLEVLENIAKLEGKDIDFIIEVAKAKRADRGGFEKRIFLEKSIKKV